MNELKALEKDLNHFDLATRRRALAALAAQAKTLAFPKRPVMAFNLHCHSFYSYNAEGLSPFGIVWMAKTMGLATAGLVDFDVLDGVDEFFEAADLLGLPVVAGFETRCFLPEFSSRELNSPGEPGVTYHMGTGFVQSALTDASFQAFFKGMVDGARRRNLDLIAKVNAFLDPVKLDYDRDVLPLTPKGVATERHICQAYDDKSRQVFPDESARAQFWAGKLGPDGAKASADAGKIQALIRGKTMKKGGVGYQMPTRETFPAVSEVNKFILAQGAIPMMTWLDGTSAGEGALSELMDTEMKQGAAALNIVPDRNWNIADPETRKRKVALFHEIVRKADERGLPIGIGTEMNGPGLKRVDDFDAPEMLPVVPSFTRGARILAAHTRFQRANRQGYLSDWAKGKFATVKDKNQYFEDAGRELIG